MRVTIQLDDDTALTYQNEAVERGMDVEDVLADRLKRAQVLDPRHRYVVLVDGVLARAEAALGGLPLLHAEDFLSKLTRLARIRFGDHRLELTAGQMEEIVWRGQKQGKTVEQMLGMAWERFTAEFFTLLPGKR